MRSLTFKLVLLSVGVAVVAVGSAALILSQMIPSHFGDYLTTSPGLADAPGRMMGRGVGRELMNMMGSPENAFLDSVGQSLWLAMLVALIAALALSLLLSRQLTAPLRRLTLATHRLADGDLAQRVPVTTGDEIGELGVAFNTMADNLSRSDQARRRLLADVAHELRTPLTVLQANLEAIIDGVAPPTAERLTTLHQQSLLLARLVTDLRDLSLAEAGQLTLHRSPTNPADVVDRAAAAGRALADERGIALSTDIADGLPLVAADADRIEQVLHNLLDNALRHTLSGGSVVVVARPAEGGVIFSIADTGSGIAPEALPHIFDRFYRGDAAAAPRDGSGIGLTVAKSLVEAHGGRIWAESQPGRGSTFLLFLPAAA